MTLPVGTRVQLSTSTPRPKRGKWAIMDWMITNGFGHVSEIGPDYFCVAIDARNDGSAMQSKRTQVIHQTDKRFTVTPL